MINLMIRSAGKIHKNQALSSNMADLLIMAKYTFSLLLVILFDGYTL